MSRVILDIPNETLLALKVSEAEIGEALRMAAAVKLFEMGRLSSGAAARLAGVPRLVFLGRLADYGVDTFKLTEEQLKFRHLAGSVGHIRKIIHLRSTPLDYRTFTACPTNVG